MCDTFVALPPATAGGGVIFGKNSDRPADEAQSVRRYPRRNGEPGVMLRCTHVEIPETAQSHATLLSQPDWMWGAEMGANEHGVLIGNEAVWTREPVKATGLTGMDLVRLGLERGESALAALRTITGLLEEHGQGGRCAEFDPAFTYHNSFLIVDSKEAYVLETAGRMWCAEKIRSGLRNISNGLTIRTKFDLAADGLEDFARERDLYDGGPFDFAAVFSQGSPDPGPYSRQACGRRMLEEFQGRITAEVMMEILRDHESGICMHGAFATTASMVSEIRPGGEARHWMTGRPFPCQNEFKEESLSSSPVRQKPLRP